MIEKFEPLRERLQGLQKVAILTGAGVSAESGVPTFRGADGLWRNHRAEQLATPEAFDRDPELVWEWYDWRREILSSKKPNPAHYALAELQTILPETVMITQNVDGLHATAGSRDVLELHGSIWQLRCTACGDSKEDRTAPLEHRPPRCDCGGMKRPGVVWFGESLPAKIFTKAVAASQNCDLFIVAGTSGVVEPAASLARLAASQGATVVESNLEPTPLTASADLLLEGPSGSTLPAFVEFVRGLAG